MWMKGDVVNPERVREDIYLLCMSMLGDPTKVRWRPYWIIAPVYLPPHFTEF